MVASSLGAVATELAADFEQSEPGLPTVVVSGGSAALREQVLTGAPADVFIPASRTHLDALAVTPGTVGRPVAVATTSLALAVPAGNPAGVEALSDLARPELLIGLCDVAVPCGQLAREWLGGAGVVASPDTLTLNVTHLATSLAAGELDAAVVYVTDLVRFDGLERVPLDAAFDAGAPRATYVAAVLANTEAPERAAAFVAYLTTSRASAIWSSYGFERPRP